MLHWISINIVASATFKKFVTEDSIASTVSFNGHKFGEEQRWIRGHVPQPDLFSSVKILGEWEVKMILENGSESL